MEPLDPHPTKYVYITTISRDFYAVYMEIREHLIQIMQKNASKITNAENEVLMHLIEVYEE